MDHEFLDITSHFGAPNDCAKELKSIWKTPAWRGLPSLSTSRLFVDWPQVILIYLLYPFH